MIIAEVLFDLVMHINVLVRLFIVQNHCHDNILLDCAMVVHRRCIIKVGNYCGCKENVLALYDKWKETVRLAEEKI